jgi:class 3 adenylate cyclase
MPLPFDLHGREIARNDQVAHDETRAKFTGWEYLIYQADPVPALNAKNALIAAIETQHASARALVDKFDPVRRRQARPRSKDEE